MLEFVLIFPIFIGLLLGTINLAILLNNNIVAASAAREAGRTAAVTGNVSNAVNQGENLIRDGGLLPFKGKVEVSNPGSREFVTAKVEYKTPVIAPGFAALLGEKPWKNEITLKEESSYYVEYRHRLREGDKY